MSYSFPSHNSDQGEQLDDDPIEEIPLTGDVPPSPDGTPLHRHSIRMNRSGRQRAQALGVLDANGRFTQRPVYEWSRWRGGRRLQIKVAVAGCDKPQTLHRIAISTPDGRRSGFRNGDWLDFTLANGVYLASPMGPIVGRPLDYRPVDAPPSAPMEDPEVTQARHYKRRDPKPNRHRPKAKWVYVSGHGYVGVADNDTIVRFQEQGLPTQWSLNAKGQLQFYDPRTRQVKLVKREVLQAEPHEDVHTGPGGRLDVTRENLQAVPSADPRRLKAYALEDSPANRVSA